MEIRELDKDFGDVITPTETSNIITDGITIRTGNKIVHLTVSSEETLPVDDLQKEYDDKLKNEIVKLETRFTEYQDSMKFTVDETKRGLEQEKRKYQDLSRQKQVLPELTYKDALKGLAVSTGLNGGFVWYYTCVYSPKFINKRRIEPSFAKRLLTPIVIKIETDTNYKVTRLSLRKVIGHDKFHHYHSLSDSSDCWGGFNYQGEVLDESGKVFTFVNSVLSVLEVINEYSLGRANPKGLSRMATLRKHLLPEDEEVTDNTPKSTINSRNSRSGFDQSVNDNLESVWTT